MSTPAVAEKPRCAETVYVRDTHRYTGRGPTGFQMYYRHQQCSRVAQPGTDKCWQHRKGTT
jgi:hypothetical protein